jgi:transposase, IS30 family
VFNQGGSVAREGWGGSKRLTFDERLEIQRRVHEGELFETVATSLDCSAKSIQRVLKSTGGVKSRACERSSKRLSLAEREEISRGLLAGESARRIATRLNRAPSTVTREIVAGGGSEGYRAWKAEERSRIAAKRPKVAKLASCSRLRAEVERCLTLRWSPQQIAGRLVVDHPDDPEMRVSHETIYQSLFIQARGALRKELTGYLRTGRTRRRPHRRTNPGGHLLDMELIADRPPEVEDRAVPGHWEGDLIIGKGGLSQIATLVERQSRFVMLVDLFEGRTAPFVREALTAHFLELPAQLARSLTWDRGKEMAEHVGFTMDTNMKVYFCDPHAPWQRGSNENTNGLLRQYFPKGTDLSAQDQDRLDGVAAELNGRPRQTLGWMTPSEAFAQAVAATA